MSELTLTDRELLEMVFNRARLRIARALAAGDFTDIDPALRTIEEAIVEGHQRGTPRGASQEQLEYREKRFLRAVPSDEKKGA